jgi:hypothetical protein
MLTGATSRILAMFFTSFPNAAACRYGQTIIIGFLQSISTKVAQGKSLDGFPAPVDKYHFVATIRMTGRRKG